MSVNFRPTSVIVASACCAALGQASAAIVTTRAELGATDSISWAQLTNSGAAANFSSAQVLSAGGWTMLVSAPNEVYRSNQRLAGEASSGFPGNFNAGDALLVSKTIDAQPNVVWLQFGKLFSAVGTQFNNSVYNGGFTAQVQVFSSSSELLETQVRAAFNSFTADGSAAFLGISRASNDIASVKFSVLPYTPPGFSSPFDRFALNGVSLAEISPIPEPSAIALVVLGLPFVSWLAYRRRVSQ